VGDWATVTDLPCAFLVTARVGFPQVALVTIDIVVATAFATHALLPSSARGVAILKRIFAINKSLIGNLFRIDSTMGISERAR